MERQSRCFAVAIQIRQDTQSAQRIASTCLDARAIIVCNLHHTTPGRVSWRVRVYERDSAAHTGSTAGLIAWDKAIIDEDLD